MQKEKKQADTIFGIEKDKIRKAYFTGKLDVILKEIQEKNEVTTENSSELIAFLGALKNQDKDLFEMVKAQVGSEMIGEEEVIKSPSLDMFDHKMTPEEIEEFNAWRKNADRAIKFVNDLMSRISKDIFEKVQIRKDDFIDYGIEISGLMKYIDEDRIYKDQIFRRELTRIKDEYGCSRKEAEEYAKLTKEYKDYKFATLFRENLDGFIMLLKKKSGFDY